VTKSLSLSIIVFFAFILGQAVAGDSIQTGADLLKTCSLETQAATDKLARKEFERCLVFLQKMVDEDKIPFILCIEQSLVHTVVFAYGNRIVWDWLTKHPEYLSATAETVVVLSMKNWCSTLKLEPKS
jgi:2-oxo-4-hydroxy-4-carboxy--5-ureidoimidazoline (OHCU) decarboxylase